MITDRDREIINFIDKIGFATINHIADLFFNCNNFAYDLARRRLKKIKENGNYLRSVYCSEINKLIYTPYDSKKTNVKIHDIKLIDYLTKLKKLGCDIKEFELFPHFNNIVPDMYLKFVFDGYEYYQLVEIQLRHENVNLDRFMVEDNIKSILNRCNNTLPTIVIVQDSRHIYENSYYDIIKLNTNLNDIGKVFNL